MAEKLDIPISGEEIGFLPTPSFHPKRILIYVGKDLLGDALIKLPFLKGIRALYPSSDIVWCAGQGKSVYGTFLAPLVKGLLTDVWDDVQYGGSWLDALAPPKKLVSPPFDLIIDTQKHVKTTLLLKRLPHELFISSAIGFYFSDRIPPKGACSGGRSLQEDLNCLLRAISPSEGKGDETPIDLPQPAVQLARELLPPNESYIGLVPGGGGRHKCWPLHRYIELAKWIYNRGHTPVFILGPQEEEWADTIQKELPWAKLPLQDQMTQDQGGPTVFITMALGLAMKFAVTNDCGTAHLLALVNTPLISLFGPTNATKFKPASPVVNIIQASTWGSKAMSSIPLTAVQEAVLGFEERLSCGVKAYTHCP